MTAVTARVAEPKPRVLLLIHELSLSGAPNVAINAFRKIAGQVELRTVARGVAVNEDQVRQFEELGPLSIVSVDAPASQLQRSLNAGARKPWRPTVMYVNSVVSLRIARSLEFPDVPVLLHVHELESYLEDAARTEPDLLLRLPQRYIAASDAVKRSLIAVGVRAEKISVVTTFVRAEEFARPIVRAPIAAWDSGSGSGSGDVPLVVGGVSVSKWHKGDTLWMLMAAELTKLLGRDRVRFLAIGVDDDENGRNFRMMARKLELDSILEIIPFTREPLTYLDWCDVVAVTSWEESASMVSLEAMMLRKPVVCFAGSGGPPELLGDTGVVIDHFSPAEMARAIAELAASRDRRRSLGQAAHDRASSSFTDDIQAPKILAEIQVLARDPSRAGA